MYSFDYEPLVVEGVGGRWVEEGMERVEKVGSEIEQELGDLIFVQWVIHMALLLLRVKFATCGLKFVTVV